MFLKFANFNEFYTESYRTNRRLLLVVVVVVQCAEDASIRELIRQYGGLVPLVNIVNDPSVNADVLLAAIGAIWKLSLSAANVAALQKLGIIPVLVRLLTNQPEKVRASLTD